MIQLEPHEQTFFRAVCAYLKATGEHNRYTLDFCRRNGINPESLIRCIIEKQLMEKDTYYADQRARLVRAGLV
jgi:hypothetical protein